jgi:hypothetical protein
MRVTRTLYGLLIAGRFVLSMEGAQRPTISGDDRKE